MTFANVVSLIALFIALGGTSYAVTAIDNNSVRSNHVVNGEVKSPDLATGAATAAKLAPNAVNSGKVVNDSLRGGDINEGTLGQVPDAATLNGLESASFLRSRFYVRTDSGTGVANSPAQITVSCDPGDIAIGGGFQGHHTQDVSGFSSYRSNASLNTWTVAWSNGPEPIGGFNLKQAQVICVDQ